MKNYHTMLAKVYAFAEKNMPAHPYHNFEHAEDVLSAVRRLSELEGICEEDKFFLETAALLHDIIYVTGKKDNEEKSAEVAGEVLPKLGYSDLQTEKVKQLIPPTKFPTNTSVYLAQVLCDADVDNFGREDFLERGEKLRGELGIEKNVNWYKAQKSLLENHKYYTDSAKKLRDEGIKRNIKKLEKLIGGE